MPIYVVGERNQRVSIPNEALAVSITGSVAEAELDVRASAQQLVVRPTAHRAVLPEIAGEVTVGVRPVGTARFGAGTVVHLEIAHDNPTEVDPVQVLFDPVDVSGESGVVFAASCGRRDPCRSGRHRGGRCAAEPVGVGGAQFRATAHRSHADAVRRVGCCGPGRFGVDAAVVRRRQRRRGHRHRRRRRRGGRHPQCVVGVRRGGGHAGGCRRVRCARHRQRGPGRRGAKGAAAVVRWCALVAAGAWSPHHRLRRLSDFGCATTLFDDHLVQ